MTEQASEQPNARTWTMWAGQRLNHGESEPVFCDIGNHPTFARMHGHTQPLKVHATEDPQGRYWGWMANSNWDRTAQPVYETVPSMIHEHEHLFNICFPYGYQSEVERNAGRVVRLTINLV